MRHSNEFVVGDDQWRVEGNVVVPELHELGFMIRRGKRMTHDSHLPKQPRIDEAKGLANKSLVLSVDGLCVAIVDQPDMLRSVAADLSTAMSKINSPSGSLLFSPGQLPDLPMALRKELANMGISVKRSNTEDLVSEAKDILIEFWRRRREHQTRYLQAQSGGLTEEL